MIGIISYGLGNVASLSNALKSLGHESYLIDSPDKFDRAEKIILPGVGSFNEAMKRLKKLGLDVEINTFFESNKPILGICLGMQLLASKGYEGGEIAGLDLIPGKVKCIKSELKLPHIGWNNLTVEKADDVLPSRAHMADYYFIHGYEFLPKNERNVLATVEYGDKIVAIIKKNRVMGFQFHPEKSQKAGLELLEYFIKYA